MIHYPEFRSRIGQHYTKLIHHPWWTIFCFSNKRDNDLFDKQMGTCQQIISQKLSCAVFDFRMGFMMHS